MNRHLKILATFCLLSGTAYAAPTVATGQATMGAQNMNNALRKMKTQQVSHLEEQLQERGLPNSVAKSPSKIFNKAVQGPFKDRLELGLTGEPTVQQGAYSMVEARGNGASHTLLRTQISAATGNIAGVQPIQHVQSTTDNAPQAVAMPHPYKDPRAGIQLTDHDVTTWRTSGVSANASQVTGTAKIRTMQPLSPGLAFKGQPLPAGSHLVTTTTGTNVTVNFNGQGATPTIATPQNTKSVTYVLAPKAAGGFTHTKVDGQDLTDLKASMANRSFTVNGQGKVVDNAAPGYDQESLRAGGFIQ